jgi:glycosyltransferase involved in cell wall biosynthesis
LRGAQHLIWEMDLYPDVAVAVGVFAPGCLLDRVVGALADFSHRVADGVIALGPCMADRLAVRRIPGEKTYVVENWVDSTKIAPRPAPVNLPLVVLYSGNLGLAHDVDTIAGAMVQLADPAHFRFVFAGGGARRPALEARCQADGIRNACFLPYQEGGRLTEHFGSCHVGLVTQNPETCGVVVPSKTYAFLAAGRPIIFVGPAQATSARIIERERCGWRIQPGDVSSLVSLLKELASELEIARLAGDRSRRALLKSYDLPAGVSRIVRIVTAGTAAPARLGTKSLPSDI